MKKLCSVGVIAVIMLTVFTLIFTQCGIKRPPLKVDLPTLEKPAPPPPPPAKKTEHDLGEVDSGVAEGVPGGVPCGIVGGVLGAPSGPENSAASVTRYCLKTPYPAQQGKFLRFNYRDFNTEEYQPVDESRFLKTLDNPLSTFSIDVDTGSYSNVRRFLTGGHLPPKDAVRIEEMINYFQYDYPEPENKHPFSITTELGACPWDPSHYLLHIGIQGKRMKTRELPPSNLVFLLDVSGSMDEPNKLPLLKSSFKLLVKQLSPRDKVTIVVYAGSAGLVLPPTPGDQKQIILDAVDRLEAGGTTAGGAGIQLAYKAAQENFIKEGNNRVILATDGDFNVGVSSTADLVRLIEKKREMGIFLTTLGFGTGNYKDGRLEQLADKGNGSYHYIDNFMEGKKVFVHDMRGTLFTIAKDVKIQVEFNPAIVDSYRLLGYENRKLQKEDFDDDKKDAGELGAGHTVTALYEIIPVDSTKKARDSQSLRFQETRIKADAFKSRELALVKLRYKKPQETTSQLITRPIKRVKTKIGNGSENLRFSAAVALFGMLLRESEYAGKAHYEDVLALAKSAPGKDNYGYRSEFIRLVNIARELK